MTSLYMTMAKTLNVEIMKFENNFQRIKKNDTDL